MCDCRPRIEEKLLNNFREQFPEAIDHRAKLTGYALIFGKELTEKGCMQIEYTAKFPLKKGGVKEKAQKVSMMFTFCPFCGSKYDQVGACKDQPLSCTIEHEKLNISIGIDTLSFCAKEHPFFWSGEDDKTPCIKVTDNAVFAKEVVSALQTEAEDGSTLLTRVLDRAMQDAVEDGCCGVDHA